MIVLTATPASIAAMTGAAVAEVTAWRKGSRHLRQKARSRLLAEGSLKKPAAYADRCFL
jgi:hypothetical protein